MLVFAFYEVLCKKCAKIENNENNENEVKVLMMMFFLDWVEVKPDSKNR